MKRFFMLLVGLALGGALFAQSAADEILKLMCIRLTESVRLISGSAVATLP